MSRANILAARQSFSDWGIWPRQRAEINPEGWLSNFDDADQEVAEALLDAFVFFNSDLTEQLFVSACMSVSAALRGPVEERVERWQTLRDTALVTFPGREDQNPTDSGHRFASIARNRLGFAEANIFRPGDVVTHLAGSASRRPLLIVDDFLGTGAQFLESWREPIVVGADATSSMMGEVRRLGIDECHVVVAVATRHACDELKENAPEVLVHAGHLLPAGSSLNNPLTELVPAHIAEQLEGVIEKYTQRSGFDGNAWGFADLATAIGFAHGVPDSTLPLYWYESETWTPLRKRR